MVRALKIKDFPDYYVTDTGDVYSWKYHPIRNPNSRIKKLKPIKNKSGYWTVSLHKDKKQHIYLVHRLVAEAFIPNPENKSQVNHKNGIRSDARAENLEWVTPQENVRHAFDVLKNKGSRAGQYGKENPKSKVIEQMKDGKVIAIFYGGAEAERKTGIFSSNIHATCKGRHLTMGGYEWRYKKVEK